MVDCDFQFLNVSWCVMLLVEHLQSYNAESSMQMEISSFKNYGSSMPTKTARRDYNELLPGFVSSHPDKLRPREHAMKGAGPCCAALEKMDSQVSKSMF